MLNHSPASERNKAAIFDRMAPYLAAANNVLEVASGSGQHAFHCTAQFTQLHWQLTELPERLAALEANRSHYAPHLPPALAMDVCDQPWPVSGIDMVYTANSLHIISEPEVACLMRGAGGCLAGSGLLCVYGPFRYHGEYTSESNARFDAMLRTQNPSMGIRDFEDVNTIAARHGLTTIRDDPMPANNQLIVWQRAERDTENA